jgi:endonuclease G
VQFDDIYVATGPILTNGLPTIGFNKVSVPKFYYKALLVYGNKGKQAIAFVLPNEASQQALINYVITIDSLEASTGIDFFAGLIDDEEALLESVVHTDNWSMAKTQAKAKTENDMEKREVSALCQGISKSLNAPCKLRTNNANGYCHHHQSQAQNTKQINQENNRVIHTSKAVQCSGTTKAGNRCKRNTTNASGRCYQH